MNRSSRYALIRYGFLLISSLGVGLAAEGEVDFNRDVRPILSANCFACHGPDEHDRKAKLRLDERESAVAPRDDGAVIDLENPGASALLARVFAADPEEVMPPPSSHKTLSEDEKSMLRRWIEEGAPYADHWALVPPEKPALPPVTQQGWPTNAVDQFVLSRLEAEGLAPSAPADRHAWLRRVTFDVTGLPPTPEESTAFAESEHLNASEREIDRLAASPRYGERMALAWLDAARYGDSSVMHADGNRDMWPWRDWLIDAYNANKPFDEFTVEQLAGDLLPNATVEQRLASGFNRNHATSDEGGAIPEELRIEYVVDRVKTTANVWLALSMECGQCHDHKYDPISQREYYEFFAYFNNTKDPGMQTRNGNQAPVVKILSEVQQQRMREARKRLDALKQRRESERAPRSEVDAWASQIKAGLRRGAPELSEWYRIGPFTANNADETFKKDFGLEKAAERKGKKQYEGKQWAVSEASWEDGKAHALDIPDNAAVYLGRELSTEKELKGTLKLGSDDGIKVWLDGKRLHENNARRAVGLAQDTVQVTLKPGKHWLVLKIVNASGPSGFAFQWQSPEYPEEIRHLAGLAKTERTEAQQEQLGSFYAKTVWPVGLELDRQLAETLEAQKAIEGAAPTAMIMEDQTEKPRVTYILSRGQYDQPLKDQPVQPGVPKALPKLPEAAPTNRLGLARWLTLPEHPLTSRVAVNRYWALLMGQGIVRTIGDFGNQGDWPSHMALLDWLATDFVSSGWDVKRALRQILLSSTYGQTSRFPPALRERDPQNRLLARASRFRLQGEFIRDQALAVSGLLVENQGGPGVKPYQPPNIWNEVSLNGGLRYKRDNGEKLYRRSLYTYWKRSAPMPNMMIFDSPSREKCALERPRTNTPLQALVTLNDPQFVEAARVLAERLLRSAASPGERIDLAYRLAVGRPASQREIDLLVRWLEERGLVYFEDSTKGEELLAVGEFPARKDADTKELGAWTLVSQLILNLDETLTRN